MVDEIITEQNNAVINELPRRKQRGITRNFDYELRKRRGTFGPSELSKALDR
jgi:hypothetical protein